MDLVEWCKIIEKSMARNSVVFLQNRKRFVFNQVQTSNKGKSLWHRGNSFNSNLGIRRFSCPKYNEANTRDRWNDHQCYKSHKPRNFSRKCFENTTHIQRNAAPASVLGNDVFNKEGFRLYHLLYVEATKGMQHRHEITHFCTI